MDYQMISHQSAYRYWLSGATRKAPKDCRFSLNDEDELRSDYGRGRAVDLLPFEPVGPIDYLVLSPSKRPSSSHSVKSHVWQGPLPFGSVCKLDNSTLIASPEFLFVLLAQTASVTQLIAYGTALCSSYPLAKVPTANHRGALNLRDTLTTKASLDAFLDNAPNHRGVKKARRHCGG